LVLDAESPRTVIELVFTRGGALIAIFAGLKEQEAAGAVQAKAMVSVKVLGPERDIVKAAVVMPMG
jgi:hypothetical protein